MWADLVATHRDHVHVDDRNPLRRTRLADLVCCRGQQDRHENLSERTASPAVRQFLGNGKHVRRTSLWISIRLNSYRSATQAAAGAASLAVPARVPHGGRTQQLTCSMPLPGTPPVEPAFE